MSIEITSNTAGRSLTQLSGRTQRRQNESQSSSVSAPTDSVTVSRDAILFQEAKRAAQAAPDIRADKVAQLQTSLQNGTYRPSSSSIAAHLLQEERELFLL